MPRKTYNNDGPNAETKALDLFGQMIIDKLEHMKGDEKWQQPWFSENAMGWPKNFSGREYNGMNSVMLKMLCEKNNYELPIFATFNRITSLNYQSDKTQGPIPLRDKDGKDLPRVLVNKGEKSFPVMLTSFTCVNKDTKEKIPYDEYRQLSDEQKKDYNVYPKLNVYNVFNIQQTNIKEVRPELYEKLKALCKLNNSTDRENSMFKLPELDAMVKEQKWLCPIDIKDENKCFYSISRDRIQMQPRSTFKTGESWASNLLHEVGHSTGRKENLDRFSRGLDNEGVAKEELIAELTAALVCSRRNILKPLKTDSIPYIKSWLDSINQDSSFVKTVLMDVKHSSTLIEQRLDAIKEELEARKEEKADVSVDDAAKKEEKQAEEAKAHNEVAAKAAPEPPKEEEEENVSRGFHR